MLHITRVTFNLLLNAVGVGTRDQHYNFNFGGWVLEYVELVLLLIPVKGEIFGISNTPFTIWFGMVVGGFLGKIMCRYQTDGYFWNKIDVVYYNGM